MSVWHDHPTSDRSFQWFKKKICPLSLLLGMLSRKKTVSVFGTGTGIDTHWSCPCPVGWLRPASHWPILHCLFSWEVKYGLCLLVTFSPVGSSTGLRMWRMPWETLAGWLSTGWARPPPTPPLPRGLVCFCRGVSPSSQLLVAQMVSGFISAGAFSAQLWPAEMHLPAPSLLSC